MLFAVVVAIVVFLSLSDGSIASKCPTIVTQNDFDIAKYMNVWYEVYRNDIIFEIGTKCVNATYTLNADGTVSVWNQATNWRGQYTSISGTAQVKNSTEPGALSVTFQDPQQQGDYNVLATNYDEYALVYSCRNVPLIGKWEFIWILSRQKTLSTDIVKNLKKTLTDMGANADRLKPTDQSC